MPCQDEDLDEYTIGDDITFGFEFFDYDDDGNLIGPSDLTGHVFRSQIRYQPKDPVSYEWVIPTPVDNVVLGSMPSTVTNTIPAGLLWWDMEDTFAGKTTTILQGRVPFRLDVTHDDPP